ncbi:MAG: 2-amino-4-hydroxy-6-hydroxymethyldihydropteridine diphosphokinase [Opitutus sp.]
MAEVRQAFIGLGANLGERAQTLRAAIDEMKSTPGISTVVCSRFYETDPVGKLDQPNFLNLVAGVETTLSPEQLLALLQNAEATFGRKRTERWGPRTLDLDLLAYEGEVRSAQTLELPHPRLLERPFVIVPLREVISDPRFSANGAWAELKAKLEQPISTNGIRLFTEEAPKLR